MQRTKDIFYKHVKTAGIELKPKAQPAEKTASDADKARADFIENATKAVFESIAADIYRDPILGKIAETGDMRRVSKLAEGRYVDSVLAVKLASMSGAEFMSLAEQGLRKKLNEKVAEAAKTQAPEQAAARRVLALKR